MIVVSTAARPDPRPGHTRQPVVSSHRRRPLLAPTVPVTWLSVSPAAWLSLPSPPRPPSMPPSPSSSPSTGVRVFLRPAGASFCLRSEPPGRSPSCRRACAELTRESLRPAGSTPPPQTARSSARPPRPRSRSTSCRSSAGPWRAGPSTPVSAHWRPRPPNPRAPSLS